VRSRDAGARRQEKGSKCFGAWWIGQDVKTANHTREMSDKDDAHTLIQHVVWPARSGERG